MCSTLYITVVRTAGFRSGATFRSCRTRTSGSTFYRNRISRPAKRLCANHRREFASLSTVIPYRTNYPGDFDGNLRAGRLSKFEKPRTSRENAPGRRYRSKTSRTRAAPSDFRSASAGRKLVLQLTDAELTEPHARTIVVKHKYPLPSPPLPTPPRPTNIPVHSSVRGFNGTPPAANTRRMYPLHGGCVSTVRTMKLPDVCVIVFVLYDANYRNNNCNTRLRGGWFPPPPGSRAVPDPVG